MAASEVEVRVTCESTELRNLGWFVCWCLKHLPVWICPAFVVFLDWDSSGTNAKLRIRPTYRPKSFTDRDHLCVIRKERASPTIAGGN